MLRRTYTFRVTYIFIGNFSKSVHARSLKVFCCLVL